MNPVVETSLSDKDLPEQDLADKDYTSRRGELSTYGRAINAFNVLKWLCLSGLVLMIALLMVVLFVPQLGRVAIVILIAALIIGLAYVWSYTTEHFIIPDLALRKWLQQLCDGELRTSIGLPETHPHFKELDFHTGNVAATLKQLSDDMENLVGTQTKRLENQNQVLELLFQLTSDVAGEIDQQSVLDTVCTDLASWLGDVPVAAYMLEGDRLKLQATNNPDHFSNCGAPSELVSEVSSVAIGHSGYQLKIPFFKGREVVGIVEVQGQENLLEPGRDTQRVFKTVSDQLSMFVAKHLVLESVHHARVIKERTRLGAEIHDSLAQTLLACRYQITMLREAFEKDPSESILKDLVRVEGIIDEANVEVRELIGQYRQSPDQQRYTDSIQTIIDDFNSSSDTPVFFQNDNPHIKVTAREGSVIQRIIREALINASKYSNATMIRVYLRVEPSGVRNVLIEDDGIGFCAEAITLQAGDGIGEHIGLSIMRDRATSIGAIITIDSEPGEGTRINLKLPPYVLLEEG